MANSDSLWMSSITVFHSSLTVASWGSSQSTLSYHSFCMNNLARTDTGLVIPMGSNNFEASLNTSRLVVSVLVLWCRLFYDSGRWPVVIAQRIPSTLIGLLSSDVPSSCAAFISSLLLEAQALKLNFASHNIEQACS